jgi:hypothetical protein
MSDTAPETTEKQEAKTSSLDTVLNDFKTAWEYASGSWHKRWQDNYRLCNNQRISVGYVGISNTFVPITSSTIDALTSGLYGSKPKFEYVPPQNKQDQKTDILNGLVDCYWDKDQWSLKVPETGKFKFMLGTAVDYFMWDIDHPVLIHVPIRDFFIDPLATTLENARFMGRRYLTTVEELESYEIVDLEAEPDEEGNQPFKKKYTNLDKVEDYKNPDPTDKEEKDMWYGSTIAEPAKGQVECIEYWTNDKVITIANRCTVIEDGENYFKAKDAANQKANGKADADIYAKGLMPFADDRDIVDPSLFYAKSTVDTIAGQQEQLNDLTNQLSDALTYIINQQYTIDPKFAHLQGQVKNLPGATYVAAKDAIMPIVRGTIPPDAFVQIQNIKNEMRETTGVNEIVKGAPSEGGKSTATEINAQVAGAGQRITLKVTQLENGYFHRMARIIFAMIRLYVTEPTMVRIIGKDGAKWEQFDPSEYDDGDYEPRIQLDITVENKKKEQAEMAKEMLAAFLNDPDVNQQELKKLALQRSFDLDPDEVNTLMQPAPAPGMPGMDPLADPTMAGQPQQSGNPLDGIPPEVLAQLPENPTEDELQLVREALQQEQQPAV